MAASGELYSLKIAGNKQKLLKRKREFAYGRLRNSRFSGRKCLRIRKEVLRMMIGVIVILIFSGLLALIIYLYQDHVDHLNHTIKMLRINKDILGEELDHYKELVEDLDGYYDKWIETMNELNKAKQENWTLSNRLEYYLERDKED